MPSFEDVRDRLRLPFDEVAARSRAVVPLSTEPVDDATVMACIDVAVGAIADSRRRCEFVVLRDPDRLHQLARIYRQGWSVYRRLLRWQGSAPVDGHQWEADHFEDVPVVVVACVHGSRPVFPAFNAARYYAPVFRALEDLLLAAHSLGLAARMTTLPVWSGWQARRTLALPRRVAPVAVVPLGWPREAIPAAPRPPQAEVERLVHHDHWGNRGP